MYKTISNTDVTANANEMKLSLLPPNPVSAMMLQQIFTMIITIMGKINKINASVKLTVYMYSNK